MGKVAAVIIFISNSSFAICSAQSWTQLVNAHSFSRAMTTLSGSSSEPIGTIFFVPSRVRRKIPVRLKRPYVPTVILIMSLLAAEKFHLCRKIIFPLSIHRALPFSKSTLFIITSITQIINIPRIHPQINSGNSNGRLTNRAVPSLHALYNEIVYRVTITMTPAIARDKASFFR